MPAVVWNGASGRKYSFELWPIGTNFNDIAGVYIFCRRLANGNWGAVYIGESSSLKGRLSSNLATHHRLDAIKRQGATHICALPISGHPSLRLAVETDLRQLIKPICNRQ